MGLFDKVSGFVKREAEDIGEAAERVRDRLDEELTEREEELEMTPAEKLRALQRKARQTDERVDKIMEKAGASAATTDAAAEVADATAPPVIREPPSVTQIVLADGSIRSGDDPTPTSGSEDVEDEDPDEGDLSWVAPRQGEEAVVPAFSSAVSAASPSDATPETPDEMPDDGDDADDTLALEPAESEPAAPEAPAPQAAQSGPPEAAPEALSTFTNDTSPALHPVSADPAVSAHPASPSDDGVATAAASTGTDLPPPPPPPMPEPAPVVQAPLEPVAPNEAPPRRETPAEIAARVVAELEQAVAEDPEPAPAAAAPPAPPEPSFDKTPAQRKYEEARKAADALLEELRGELRDDGEI